MDAARKYEVTVIDYGVKRNILRALSSVGAHVTVVPAGASAEEILARNPDGILLSNGPGDPAATAAARRAGDPGAAWPAASRCSASASATSCWRSPSAPGP